MLEKRQNILNKILSKLWKIFDTILNTIWIERKIKEIDCNEIFIKFYQSEVSDSQIILDELWSLVKKCIKTWVMQESNWNSYSLEIYPEKVVIINNNNNQIWKCNLDAFVEKIKDIKKTK